MKTLLVDSLRGRERFGPLLIQKMGLSLLVLLFLWASAEVFLRVRYRGRGDLRAGAVSEPPSVTNSIHRSFFRDENGCFRIRPNARGWHTSVEFGRVEISINSDGLRGPELMAAPDYRIGFIGDSVTFSGSVRWQDTFVAVVESALSQAYPSCRIECLNYGMTDSGIDDYLLKLQHHVLKNRPTHVVLCFYLNDLRPPQGFLGERGMMRWEGVLERSPLYASIVVRHLHTRIRRVMYASQPELRERFRWGKRMKSKRYLLDAAEWDSMVREAEFDWGAAWIQETWNPVDKKLRNMRDLCSANGVDFSLVCFPVSPQLELWDQPYPRLDFPQQHLARLTSDLGIAYLDLLTELRKRGATGAFIDQCHLSASGSRVVGEILYRWLETRAIIDTCSHRG